MCVVDWGNPAYAAYAERTLPAEQYDRLTDGRCPTSTDKRGGFVEALRYPFQKNP